MKVGAVPLVCIADVRLRRWIRPVMPSAHRNDTVVRFKPLYNRVPLTIVTEGAVDKNNVGTVTTHCQRQTRFRRCYN